MVECDSNPSEISLQDQLICTETFIPFFRALQCQLSLTRLQLAGNQIGNSGFIQLGVSLRTLPNVTLLDVSLNDITVEGLNGFVEQLTSKSGDEVDVASSVGQPLSRLCDLNLSYNSLGDDIGSALTKLLAQCVSLSSLALDACKLTSGFKTGEWMADKQGKVQNGMLLLYNGMIHWLLMLLTSIQWHDSVASCVAVVCHILSPLEFWLTATVGDGLFYDFLYVYQVF